MVGDAKEGLAALLPLLKQRSDTKFLEKYQKEMAQLAATRWPPWRTPGATRSRRST